MNVPKYSPDSAHSDIWMILDIQIDIKKIENLRKWITEDNILTDARNLVLVFTHSPSPAVEKEEIEIDDKNKKDDVEFGNSEDEDDDMVTVDEEDEDEEASKLEINASIHYVSRSVRLRPGEKLVAEVSSSSSPSVLSSPMSGILLS